MVQFLKRMFTNIIPSESSLRKKSKNDPIQQGTGWVMRSLKADDRRCRGRLWDYQRWFWIPFNESPMRIWSRAKAESKSKNITKALIILLVLNPLLKIKVYPIRKSAPRFLLSPCWSRSFVEVTALAALKTESIWSILPCIVDYPNLFLRLARLGEHQFWCGGPLFAPLPNIRSIAAISFSNNCQIASFVVLQTTQNHRRYI